MFSALTTQRNARTVSCRRNAVEWSNPLLGKQHTYGPLRHYLRRETHVFGINSNVYEKELSDDDESEENTNSNVKDNTSDACLLWLLSLDNGSGALVQYLADIVHEYGGDLNKVAATRKLNHTAHSILDCVDDSFWEAINVRTLGHKCLLARGILKL